MKPAPNTQRHQVHSEDLVVVDVVLLVLSLLALTITNISPLRIKEKGK
jgi:hypothetical protein